MSDFFINNERILLVKTAQGDESAFSQLFKLYYNQLGDFIFKLAESRSLTQEIVQDVFLKVWVDRTALVNIKSFRAYLFVVARNHCFNCLKQIAREETRKREWVNAILYNAVNSVDESEFTDTCKMVDEAVELLPSQQRKVYTLSRNDGIKQEDIARQLNISHQTVKKHMVLAIRFLKSHLMKKTGLMFLFVNLLAEN